MKQFVLKSVSMILIISLLSAQNFSILANTKSVPVTFDESVFSYDEDLLMAELSDINKLDVYVEANEGITLDRSAYKVTINSEFIIEQLEELLDPEDFIFYYEERL